jgi:membrane-associated phospholipid phosphatase
VAADVRHHPGLRGLLRRRFDPGAATGLLLTTAAALAAAGAVAIIALWLMIRREAGLERLDARFARWGAEHSTEVSTDVMRSISLLGGTSAVVVIPAAVWLLDRRRIRSRSVPVFLALVVGGQFALSNLVKLGVERARPDFARLTGYAGYSFPSGHATAAAATFAACALVLGRRRGRWAKATLTGGAAAIAVAVAATRVLLGVHWFTDVLAGMALGWAWFALCSIAFGGRLMHFGTPVEVAQAVAAATPADPGAGSDPSTASPSRTPGPR